MPWKSKQRLTCNITNNGYGYMQVDVSEWEDRWGEFLPVILWWSLIIITASNIVMITDNNHW